MRTSEENIRQLLEMLDNPDAYTEQEIQDIIKRDEETRETYYLMVAAKRSSSHRQHQKTVDVDAAWQRFLNAQPLPSHQGEGAGEGSVILKIAASFIGLLFVSGIAFAAIHIARHSGNGQTRTTADSVSVRFSPMQNTKQAEVPTDTVAVQPIVYDNMPLEKMLPEIAAHYAAEVTFANEEVRRLRFRFVWNPQQGIDQVISDLNQFERLTVTRKDNQITIDGLLNPSEK